MTDQTDPRIDARITAALHTADAAVPHTPGDVVMDDVCSARDRHRSRRRRRARIVALGAAAAVLVLVVGVAVLMTGNDSGEQHVASESTGDATTEALATPPGLQVEPSTGLTDGDTVTVSGIDDVLPAGATTASTVIAQCVTVGDRTHLACSQGVLDTFSPDDPRPPDREQVPVRNPMTPLFELRTDDNGRTTVGDWSEEAGLFCDAGAEFPAPAAPEGRDDTDGRDPDDPVSSDGDAASSASSSSSNDDTTGTCVIAVFDRSGTAPPTTVPIFFGDDEPGDQGSPDRPGTAGGSAQSPGTGSATPGMAVPAGCPEPVYGAPVPGPESDTGHELLDFTPDRALLCNYEVTNTADVRTIDDPGELARIRDELNELELPPDELVCTDEMGPLYALVAEGDGRTLTIWIQHYGCGKVFTGDQLRIGAKSLDWL